MAALPALADASSPLEMIMTRQLRALLSQLEGSGVLLSSDISAMMDQLQQRMRPFGSLASWQGMLTGSGP